MFQQNFYCLSNLSIEAYIDIQLEVGREIQYFTLEPCELGKNLNLKYKEVIDKFEAYDTWKLNEYYWINYNGSNASLYSHPSLKNEYETILILKIIAECDDFTFMNEKKI